jgi:hypothetical protein
MNALNSDQIRESNDAAKIVRAAQDGSRVVGLTHNFYRYPARFSPVFVRSVIEAYTQPGDWVIDPFAGGGTTLVEALALGRNALGIDISSLATFVSDAKTQQLNEADVAAFERWRARLPDTINMHAPGQRFDSYADAGYYRNLEGPEFWRLRKAIEQCIASVERLRCNGAHILARCAILKTAQWALDSRKTRPSVTQFKSELIKQAGIMLDGALGLKNAIEQLDLHTRPRAISINRTTAGAELEDAVQKVCPPKLIVTSPPYPGIHVLYHRWQVDGRKEAPAPFWIAGKLDGAGLSYYTMGDRQNPGLNSYFENLEASFRSIAAMAGPDTIIVQMVAFSEAEWQLPRYLKVMQACGLEEDISWGMVEGDGRLWRDVPNRKWHAQRLSKSPGAKEVVLVHRLMDV